MCLEAFLWKGRFGTQPRLFSDVDGCKICASCTGAAPFRRGQVTLDNPAEWYTLVHDTILYDCSVATSFFIQKLVLLSHVTPQRLMTAQPGKAW